LVRQRKKKHENTKKNEELSFNWKTHWRETTQTKPDDVQNDLPNLSISVGGGIKRNYDCLSNGE